MSIVNACKVVNVNLNVITSWIEHNSPLHLRNHCIKGIQLLKGVGCTKTEGRRLGKQSSEDEGTAGAEGGEILSEIRDSV